MRINNEVFINRLELMVDKKCISVFVCMYVYVYVFVCMYVCM